MSFTVSRESNLPPRSVYDSQLFRDRDALRQTRIIKEESAIDAIVSAAPPSTATCATTANHGLSGLSAVDGVTPVAGDRVLVWKQTTPSENGIYIAASGTWARAVDVIYAGSAWEVLQGTLYGNRRIVCTNDTDPVTGTDAITFAVRPGGTGTGNKLTRWTSTATLGDSLISDDGTRVQLGTTVTTGVFNVERNSVSAAAAYIGNTSGTGAGTALYVTAASSNAASHAAEFHNSGGGAGVSVTTTGAGNGIEINVSAGYGVQCNPIGNGTAFASSRNVSTATTPLFDLHEDHASASGTTIEATNDGTGKTASFSRNNASATTPVTEIIQDAESGAQSGLYVRNDSTNAAATGIYAQATNGIGGFFQSGTNTASYAYRNNAAGTAPTCVVWQDNTGDSTDVLYVRGDGTGNLLVLNTGATNVFEVSNAGHVNLKKSRSLSHASHSSSFTAAVDTCVYLIDTAAAAGNVTITLPDNAAMPSGWTVYVKDVGNNAATRNIIIARGAGDTYTINNVAGSYTIATNKRAVTLFWDGTNMHVLHASTT